MRTLHRRCWLTVVTLLAITIGVPSAHAQNPPQDERAPHQKKDDKNPAIQVTLALSTAATLSAVAENDKRNACVAAAGTDALGALPMGTGREDQPFKDKSYICATEMIGTVTRPDNPAGIEFKFKRLLSHRMWTINAQGANWIVRSMHKQGVGAGGPHNDTSSAYDDNTPSATKKIYSFDNSGVYLTPAACNVGDYVMVEKKFTYIVEARQGGGAWATCGSIDIYQKILTKKKAATGVIADDWEPLGNSYTQTETNLLIDKDKVKAVVGGDGSNITIEQSAN